MMACPWKGPWSGYPLYALLKSLVFATIPHANWGIIKCFYIFFHLRCRYNYVVISVLRGYLKKR